MDKSLKETLWRQFSASIDMLENAIKLCPPEFWDTEKKFWSLIIAFLKKYLPFELTKVGFRHRRHNSINSSNCNHWSSEITPSSQRKYRSSRIICPFGVIPSTSIR